MEKRLRITDIKIENRHRKDLGDIKGLASSIRNTGLLQAIGVTKDGNRLVFGERRLRATEMNGDEEIDCRILDLKNILEAEQAENEYRLSLSLTEKHALAEALRAEAAGMERRGGDHGNQHTGGKRQSGQAGRIGTGRTQAETRTRIAAGAGFNSEQEMRRVSEVVEKGVPELIETMDKGEIPVSTAATVAKIPDADKQREALDKYKREGHGPRGKSHAVIFKESMEETLQRILGINSKHGSVKGMFDSSSWATSTSDEKRECIIMTLLLSSALTKAATEMREYGKTHLGMNGG